uniref:Uncharacterized protein n=1 Tax=Rousettus aegyptiacus TaxID=9407 RepID=A0A7J8CIV4_ROUAE|nr:hypothetical protein HJG63_009215 [Rousettus aegyptiacus]
MLPPQAPRHSLSLRRSAPPAPQRGLRDEKAQDGLQPQGEEFQAVRALTCRLVYQPSCFPGAKEEPGEKGGPRTLRGGAEKYIEEGNSVLRNDRKCVAFLSHPQEREVGWREGLSLCLTLKPSSC